MNGNNISKKLHFLYDLNIIPLKVYQNKQNVIFFNNFKNEWSRRKPCRRKNSENYFFLKTNRNLLSYKRVVLNFNDLCKTFKNK